MHRSIFQIFRNTPLNPNLLDGSSSTWDLRGDGKLDTSISQLKGILSKYLVRSTIAVSIFAVAIATYHFDALRWIEKQLPSWNAIDQRKQSPERKVANSRKTQKADKRKGKR